MSETKGSVSLKLLIDKKRGIVLVAEAAEDLVNIVYDVVCEQDAVFPLFRKHQETGCSQKLWNSIENLKTKPSDKKTYCCQDSCGFHCSDDPRALCPICQWEMNEELEYVAPPRGSVKAGLYTITDDLEIKPLSHISFLVLTRNTPKEDADAWEEKLLHLRHDQVVKLAYATLHSKTVLTDSFLKADGETKDEYVVVEH